MRQTNDGGSEDPIYVAIIGDIRGSRVLEDGKEVQKEFKQVVESLNR